MSTATATPDLAAMSLEDLRARYAELTRKAEQAMWSTAQLTKRGDEDAFRYGKQVIEHLEGLAADVQAEAERRGSWCDPRED